MNPKVVILSGGSRGLGQAIVEIFLKQPDFYIATFSRQKSKFIKRIEENRNFSKKFFFREIDLQDRESVKKFVDDVYLRFKRVDILINNASVAIDGILANYNDEDIEKVININLKSTIQLTKYCIRKMLLNDSGRIINISSVVGLMGINGLSVYSSTKAAMDGLTRSLARELGSRGITVNSIAPGYLNTDMSHQLSEKQLKQIIKRTPIGRLGETSDVVPLILFLCSQSASFITGQVFVIDGGVSL